MLILREGAERRRQGREEGGKARDERRRRSARSQERRRVKGAAPRGGNAEWAEAPQAAQKAYYGRLRRVPSLLRSLAAAKV
eukprot:7612492-Pyramimonas_sp.AAC.1